jgi:hypothetical protein
MMRSPTMHIGSTIKGGILYEGITFLLLIIHYAMGNDPGDTESVELSHDSVQPERSFLMIIGDIGIAKKSKRSIFDFLS